MLLRPRWTAAIGASMILALPAGYAQDSGTTRPVRVAPSPSPRDGSHDFDFEIGSWKTSVAAFAPADRLDDVDRI